ncbi:MAG: glycosyltransferase family 2 protein [Salinivirgaceae bacterium]
MKVAFISFVYHGVEPFLNDFFNSLQNQTHKDFDLIIVNDSVENFNSIVAQYPDLNIIEIKHASTPIENRIFGFKYLINNGYSHVILGDSDDFFTNNRIETALKYLKRYNIVVNDLIITDGMGVTRHHNYFSQRISNGKPITKDFIFNKNIFGLSNTAVQVNLLENIVLKNDLLAVDWYIFTKLLALGFNACFTNEMATYYRQHSNNFIGIHCDSKEKIIRGAYVKYQHYKHLAEEFEDFEKMYNEYKQLIIQLEQFPESQNTYILKHLNFEQNKNYFWWENIEL